MILTQEFKKLSQKKNASLKPQNCQNKYSKDKIKITHHALQRYTERVNNERVAEKELRNLAYKARYSGISTRYLQEYDFKNQEEIYRYLNKYYRPRKNSQEIRYYNGYAFVFGGHHSRTLITIIYIMKDINKDIQTNNTVLNLI